MSELAKRLIAENKEAYKRGDESCKRLELGNCDIRDLAKVPSLFECIWIEELILSNTWGEWSCSEENWITKTVKMKEIKTIYPIYLKKYKNLSI